ncbi:MAG: hypothetical protein JJW03_00195 [Desulfosarcina sp.]|nr:hypothetical protein [Desulfobacterales bacterium]
MITAKEIRKQLRPFFGRWNMRPVIILTDPKYDEITPDDLRSEIIDIPPKEKCDCDDHARKLESHIRDKHPQWPVGRCCLTRVAGIKTDHTMIAASTTDGIYLIEPQAVWDIGLKGMQKIWKADVRDDKFLVTFI